MSWDATFYARADGHLILAGEWDYTHNTNRMINSVIGAERMGQTRNPWWADLSIDPKPNGTGSWWEFLDQMSGTDGASFLDGILSGLRADPDRFREMNPDNGWGDFDTLLKVLQDMADTSRKFPSGKWEVGG